MSNLFTNVSENVLCIDFNYREKNIDGNSHIYILDENFDSYLKNDCKTGKIYLRKPTWALMNDIYRVSGVFNGISKKHEIDPYQYRDMKIKRMVISIEDAEGNITKIDDQAVDSMVPQLANFILRKIDNILEIDYRDDSLTRDEARELSFEIYKYLSKKRDRENGKFAVVPPPPSSLIIYQLCEKYNILPDEARKISLRDLEIMNLVAEQQDIINNPMKYGNGNSDAHIKFRRG